MLQNPQTPTFTKDYAVGYEPADLDIPTVLWVFVSSQPQHSKGIMQLVGEWGECNTFAVCSKNDAPQFTLDYGRMLQFCGGIEATRCCVF